MGARGPAKGSRTDREKQVRATEQAKASENLAIVKSIETPEPPIPPESDWDPATVSAWSVFWSSDIARVATTLDSLTKVHRLFTYYDEWIRSMREFRKERLVTGSTGQLVLNPLGAWAMKVEAAAEKIEASLGIGPRQRMELGIAFGDVQRTLEERNKALAADQDEAKTETEDEDPRLKVASPD